MPKIFTNNNKNFCIMQEKTKKISPIKERILYFVETLGISKRRFYERINVSRGTLESESSITEEILTRFLAAYPDISETWLLTGEGEMLKKSKNMIESIEVDRKRALPLLPVEAIAGWTDTTSASVMDYECEWLDLPQFLIRGAHYLIRVSGDSMYPEYRSGDILACLRLTEVTFFQWGKNYVIDSSQGVMVKRIEECPDNDECVLCISENPRHKPFRLPKADIRSLSLVVGLIRAE